MSRILSSLTTLKSRALSLMSLSVCIVCRSSCVNEHSKSISSDPVDLASCTELWWVMTERELMLQMWASNPAKVKEMTQWCFMNPFEGRSRSERKRMEKDFGNRMLEGLGRTTPTSNWTTMCVETFVEFVLNKLFKDVHSPKYKPEDIGHCAGHVGVWPDFENKLAIWEVKARTWNTAGSAGDKIFAAPWKYGPLAVHKKKPVIILLVARQEQEMREKYGFFGGQIAPAHRAQLSDWESKNIHYVPFTRLLKRFER